MTPEERIAATFRGIVNRVNWRLDEIDRLQRWTRPTTPEDLAREERRRLNRANGRRP